MQAAGVKDVIFLSDLPGGECLVDQELFRNLRTAYDMLCGTGAAPHAQRVADACV